MTIYRDVINVEKDRYQLRGAAAGYWLLDMKQPGKPYVQPIPVNEGGAQIWNMWQQGMSVEEIASELSAKYGVSTDEVKDDIYAFFHSIMEHQQ